MKIYESTLKVPGSILDGSNPQPQFRAKCANMHCVEDGTLRTEEHIGYGVGCSERTLPYRMQDRYDRSEDMLCLKTVVMENDLLKATFLPGYGGKLWSLYSKQEQRELLFVNPVFRFANLANRNAWISGGIEWNLGHTGHSAFTNDDLFCAKVTAPDGEEFLRMYEYEATHAQILQLDFHLPDGAAQLAMHVRIQNARSVPSPLYWWTNVGIPLTDHTRVFSGTPEIIYQLTPDPDKKVPAFGHCRMPEQPNIPGVDLSYPRRIPHSLEYFFQNSPRQTSPWEVSIEQDGKGFMERSTQPLRIRKMFCWGSNTGGRHWCDYLSRPGEGDYIELQAGLAPTQLHTDVLPADGIVMFTQMFGAFAVDPAAQSGEWNAVQPDVEAQVESILPAAQVQRLHMEYTLKSTLRAGEMLHTGSFYGGLEMARRALEKEPAVAMHLDFPLPAGREADAWNQLLQGNALPEDSGPLPYLTDEKWLPYLEKACEASGWQTRFQYGVSLAENGMVEKARAVFKQLAESGDPWSAHALGALAKRDEDAQQAAEYFLQAYRREQGTLDVSFAEDALESLLHIGQYRQAWELFEQIPETSRTERELLLAAEAAVKLEKFDFLEEAFRREYSAIREGAVGLSDVWWEYKARLAARENKVEYHPDQIDRSLKLPRNLNFLMFQVD